jgi:hypothetical protein
MEKCEYKDTEFSDTSQAYVDNFLSPYTVRG